MPPWAMANDVLRVREGSRMTQYPASLSHDRLVALLDRAGFRPEPARALSGFPAWGAPVQHTAYCPACHTEGARIVDSSRIFVAEDGCSVPSPGQSGGGPRDDDPSGDRDDDK